MTEYRIDDLSRAAGTTSRNVRVYQERGLLDPPRLVGRTGWYTEEQLTRVRLVCQLVERGHTLSGIRDMLDTWERGGDLNDLLGVERVITRPWLDDAPRSTTLDDMQRRFGAGLTPATAERAAELGMIEPDGDGIRMPSPRIIDAGTALVELGVPFPTVLDIAEEMKQRAATIAALFVEPIRDQLVPDGVIPPSEDLPAMATAIDTLRPLAFSATEAFLAQAMQHALTQVFGRALLHTQEQADAPDRP
jgi:DNA-binding transcriptional MerR regulator